MQREFWPHVKRFYDFPTCLSPMETSRAVQAYGRVSPLSEVQQFGAVRAVWATRGAVHPAVVLMGASFMTILFFPPIFGLRPLSGLAFSPVVQMFSSLHSFENNGLFAGH